MSYSIQTDSFGNLWIYCMRCKLGSYNPNDIAQKYCGHCHIFHEDQDALERMTAGEQ